MSSLEDFRAVLKERDIRRRRKTRNILIASIIAFILLFAFIYVSNLRNGLYPMERYDDLLNRLKAEGYEFLDPRNLQPNASRKQVLLIHDVDFRMDGCRILALCEAKAGVRSIFFIRPDADYFTQKIGYFRALERESWSIGFHYDCLSRCGGNGSRAIELFKAQLVFLRSFFTINFTRYHGDNYNFSINNRAIYDLTLWTSLQILEVSGFSGSYIADTNHEWIEPSQLSDHVLVNLHSDYW